jgi:hypothetical protein
MSTEQLQRTFVSSAVTALDAVMDVARREFADGTGPGMQRALIDSRPIEIIESILGAVVAIAEEIKKGLGGQVSAESVEDAIAAIADRMRSNDAVVDAAIDTKLPDGSP